MKRSASCSKLSYYDKLGIRSSEEEEEGRKRQLKRNSSLTCLDKNSEIIEEVSERSERETMMRKRG